MLGTPPPRLIRHALCGRLQQQGCSMGLCVGCAERLFGDWMWVLLSMVGAALEARHGWHLVSAHLLRWLSCREGGKFKFTASDSNTAVWHDKNRVESTAPERWFQRQTPVLTLSVTAVPCESRRRQDTSEDSFLQVDRFSRLQGRRQRRHGLAQSAHANASIHAHLSCQQCPSAPQVREARRRPCWLQPRNGRFSAQCGHSMARRPAVRADATSRVLVDN